MTEQLPIPIADFSKEAIQRHVVTNVIQKPLTIYSVVIGIAAAAGGIAFSVPLAEVIGVGGVFVGVALLTVDYFFRYEQNAQRYLQEMRDIQQKYLVETPGRLKKEFEGYNCAIGLRQLEELEKSFRDLQELLERKFSKRGLTLNRFLAVSELVRAAALEKLQMVLDYLKAIESIPADLDQQVQQRNGSGAESTDATEERVGHRSQALEHIANLHGEVEVCLTRISDVSLQIASVGGGEDKETQYEAYLDDLRRLAAQASGFQKEI